MAAKRPPTPRRVPAGGIEETDEANRTYHRFRPYLSQDVFDHLRNGHLARESGDYLAAAVWGSVFLEGLLSTLLSELGARQPKNDDLNGRIDALRGLANQKGRGDPDVPPDDVVKRCDEIRMLRNRIVHHTGLSKADFKAECELIAKSLDVVLSWYASVREPRETIDATQSSAEPSRSVMLSTITPHTPLQEDFLEGLRYRLLEIGFQTVRLEYDDFDKRDPWGKALNVMRKVDAVVVVGMERAHSYYLLERAGSDREREHIHRKYTSGWLHLEAGMAYALGKPLFILCEAEICSEGAFDRDWNTFVVKNLHSLDPASKEVSQFLKHFAVAMADGAATAKRGV